MPRSRTHITEQPEIKKLKRGGYAARFRIPQHDGKPESKSPWRKFPDAKKIGEAREEAYKYKQELEDDINDYASKTDIALGVYARNWQDERKETGEIQPSTWARDDQKIRSIEECEIAKIPIADIAPGDIDKFKAEMKKKGWSAYKQKRTLEKLKQILKFAENRREIPYDPSRSVKGITAEATERKAIPRDTLIKMIFALDHERKDGKRAAVRVAIGTGFRLGECLGLQWKDLHLTEEHAYISLRRQLNRQGELVAPKHNETGDIPIDDATAQWLWDWRVICFDYWTNISEEQFETMPVCCNGKRGYLSHTNFTKWWKAYCVEHNWGTFADVYRTVDANGHSQIHRIGYEGPRFHEIRHTMATQLLGTGADLRTVQAIMRHKSIRSTEPYLHSIDENMIAATAKVAESRQYIEGLRPSPFKKRPIQPEAEQPILLVKPKVKRKPKH